MIKQEDCIIPISVPSLDDMLQDSVKKELCSWHSNVSILHAQPDRIIKCVAANNVLSPKYLNFLNLKWREITVFLKKAGVKSLIHQDIPFNLPRAWAINWVYTGCGYHNFWDMNSVTRVEGYHRMDYAGRSPVIGYQSFKSDLPPDVSFYTDASTPYLVSTYVPHQVHALTDRVCFSLRAHDDHANMPWDEILTRLNTHNTVESTK